MTRYERQPTIFDYLISSAEERSQAPLVLQREANAEQDLLCIDVIEKTKNKKNRNNYFQNSPPLECLWCQELFERWENSFLEISCKECSLYMKEKYKNGQ